MRGGCGRGVVMCDRGDVGTMAEGGDLVRGAGNGRRVIDVMCSVPMFHAGLVDVYGVRLSGVEFGCIVINLLLLQIIYMKE